MDENYVNYGALDNAASVYSQQSEKVGEALTSLLNLIGALEPEWRNNTARAFFERFNSEYKPVLTNCIEVLGASSEYLVKYKNMTMENDSSSAANL